MLFGYLWDIMCVRLDQTHHKIVFLYNNDDDVILGPDSELLRVMRRRRARVYHWQEEQRPHRRIFHMWWPVMLRGIVTNISVKIQNAQIVNDLSWTQLYHRPSRRVISLDCHSNLFTKYGLCQKCEKPTAFLLMSFNRNSTQLSTKETEQKKLSRFFVNWATPNTYSCTLLGWIDVTIWPKNFLYVTRR